MDTVWLILGIVILGATLLDVFLAALNYDEAGFFAGRLARLQWRVLRRGTRRLPRRWRPVALRQVTGLQIVTIVIAWLCGVILGFGLIYYGQMSPSAFSVSGTGAGLHLFDALYFSAAQLSTVGGSSLTAETDVLRFLSITETLSGVVLVSLILTFLLGVYGVIGDLNALCTQFFTAERGAGSPVASLAPYFREGQPSGLDGHLDGIAGSFSSYADGLRLNHAAYYFQSGRDRYALPYALRMLGGTLGALRWGLPSGHPAAAEPGLVSLSFQFLEFGDYLMGKLRWTSVAVPEAVGAAEFADIVRDGHSSGRRDEWVARFVQLNQDMARLAALEPLADVDDAHRRYTAWLPFAYRAQQITLAVSSDLDYQPVLVTDRPVSLLHPDDAVALQSVEQNITGAAPAVAEPADPGGSGRLSRWRTFLDRHLSLVDPGHARLRAAGRAVLAAVATVASLYLLFDLLGRDNPLQPALFGGFVAMQSTGLSGDKTLRGRQLTSVLVVVPVVLVVALGALASESFLWTGVLAVAVAGIGVWAGRFGARWVAIGRATFMSYYFALILRLDLSEVLFYGAAAVLGVAWAYVLNYAILREHPRTLLRSGFDGFSQRLVTTLDVLVDAVSWARWDPDVRKRVDADMRQLHQAAAFLAGQVNGPESETGVARPRGMELRLRLFDTELAATNLTAAARNVTGTTISLELRGRLAGRLELLQAHLSALARPGSGSSAAGGPGSAGLAPWEEARPPETWPAAARLLHRATDELYRAAAALRSAAIAAYDPDAPPAADPDDADVDDDALDELVRPPATTSATGRQPLPPTTRRALQAAVATGAALGVGDLVSSTHQYWAVLAAYQALGGTDGETFVKGLKRVAGTVTGAILGFGIAIATDAHPAVVLPLLAVAVFASTYYRPVSPAVSAVWTTTIFATLYEYLGRLTPLTLELRVLETLLGAAIALLVAWKVFPTHTRAKLDKDVSTLLTDVDVVVSGALERAGGNERISQQAIWRRLLVIDQDVRRVNATAGPLRRSAGALEDGGIEGRLTAIWSLAHATRHLVHAVEHTLTTAGAGRTTENWPALRSTTSANLAALTAALSGRLPGQVDPDLPVSDEYDRCGPLARPEDAVLRQLERINQTLLLLLSDISPGAVDPDGSRESAPV